METTISISEVQDFSPEIAEDIRGLAQKIGENYKHLSDEDFRELIASPNTSLYVAQNTETKQIIGMVTLLVYRIPYVKKASMEDLVVSEEYRGQGIGTKLIEKILEEAQKKGAAYLDFSSRPRREGENKMYEKLGFKQRETNVYRHIFDYKEV